MLFPSTTYSSLRSPHHALYYYSILTLLPINCGIYLTPPPPLFFYFSVRMAICSIFLVHWWWWYARASMNCAIMELADVVSNMCGWSTDRYIESYIRSFIRFLFHSIVYIQTSPTQNFFSFFFLFYTSHCSSSQKQNVWNHVSLPSRLHNLQQQPCLCLFCGCGDGACDECAHVTEREFCINLLSFLILQSYQERWQAQMRQRRNYRLANKCRCVSICVCVGDCAS